MKRISRKSQARKRLKRKGIAALWVIILVPCLLVALCLVIEISNLWIARAELETGLEAAALAAVKEWGDAGGAGGTLGPRNVGIDFADSNTVRGNALVINDNYNAADVNGNDDCDGDLVFGAITSSPADAPNHVFNAEIVPSCAAGGTVLFDASSNASMDAPVSMGNVDNDNANGWGINFQELQPPINPALVNLRIRRIIYDLQPNGNNPAGPRFDLNAQQPFISTGQIIGAGPAPCNVAQDDTFGFNPLLPLALSNAPFPVTYSNAEIQFGWDPAAPDVLVLDFPTAPDALSFLPGERIRFSATVAGVALGPPATAANDGDGIGREETRVSVFFHNGIADLAGQPVTAQFFDSNLRGNFATVPDLDPNICVNRPFVLPESPANGNGNDDQSYVLLSASGGGDPFAVRARKSITVPSVCMNLFGLTGTGFDVQAETYAFYDCDTRRPSLIRIADFICAP